MKDFGPSDLIIDDRFQRMEVDRIDRHPTADLALITLTNDIRMESFDSFTQVMMKPPVAHEIRIAGYTGDMMAAVAVPTLTVGEGGIAQISPNAEPPGTSYRYHGAILNDRVVPGMSGSAIFDWWFAQELSESEQVKAGQAAELKAPKSGGRCCSPRTRNGLKLTSDATSTPTTMTTGNANQTGSTANTNCFAVNPPLKPNRLRPISGRTVTARR